MEELDSLLQVIGSPAYFFDMASHRLLSVNEPFAAMMEFEANDLLEMKVDDLRPADDLAKLAKALRQQPPEGSVEWRYKTQSGKILYVRLSYRNSLYFDRETGKKHDIRLVVVSSWDTQRMRSAEELFG